MSSAFGVTPTGFVRKTFADIQVSLFGYWRSKISKHLHLNEKTGLGNVGNGAAVQLAEAWEALEGAYYAGDPDDGDDTSFVATAELTGTVRHGATSGQVEASCKLAAGTYPANALVAHVEGQPTNRWKNRDLFIAPTTNVYGLVFVSELQGSGTVAALGKLNKVAQPYAGFFGVENEYFAARPGQDVESIEELALRRVTELQGSGSGPLAAIMARVSKVTGVISVRGIENTTDVYDVANGVPPHAYRIVAWDGTSPAALNNDIAAAILAAGTGGIPCIGSSSGVANGRSVPFDRAVQVPIYVSCTITGTAGLADVQAAIIAKGASLTSGNNVIAEKIRASITDTPGVTDLLAFAIGTAPAPVAAANIPIPITSIGLFDTSRISVTFA